MTGVLVAHPGAELYGSDRVLAESVRGLVDHGYRVTVTLPQPGPLTQLLGGEVDVHYLPMPVLRKSALRPRGLAELTAATATSVPHMVRLIRSSGSSRLLVNTITLPAWLLAGRLAGVRTICHVHEAEGSAGRIVGAGLYAPVRLADRIIVNSRYALDVLSSHAARLRRRSVVVLNPVAGPPGGPTPLPELDGHLRLVYVGRLSRRKGPHVVLDAMVELTARGRSVSLTVVGDAFAGGEEYAEGLRQQAADQRMQVEFRGFESDVWPQLSAAHICLVPSTVDEPFGNTAVEAVLAGRPLVVSDTSGLREAAAGYRSAVRVPPSDPGALADAVESLASSWDTLGSLVAADSRRAAERHSLTTYRSAVATVVQ